ncbi:MAG: DUF2752 domain-containing protein [Bacteroidetes bacterium]|nr:DUF2752 domain-containing protein [Bacteroidota bacterium]
MGRSLHLVGRHCPHGLGRSLGPVASGPVPFQGNRSSGCPGCGLGHALGYLFRGEWALAIESHRLSPFVLGVLLARTAGLVRQGFSRT